jgi:phosphonate transport system substrate-binding protein
MKQMRLGLVLVLAALACGCTSSGISAAGAETERPKVIRYAYNDGSEDPQAQMTRLDLLKDYLSERLNVEVEVYKTTGAAGAVIEAMRAKKVDLGTMGPFAYLIASEKIGAEVIAVRGTRDGGPGDYGGTIAVARNSPIKTIEELVARSKDLTFSFVDPTSASGFFVQRAYFQSVGLDPERDFKKTMFSTQHIASAMTLIAGKVDAAAIMEARPGNSLYKRLYGKGRIKEGDIRILWQSPRLPSSPVVARAGLPTTIKQEVQQAFLDMPERAPELWKIWPKSGIATADSTWLPGDDAMFDELRTIVRGIKDLGVFDQ